MHAGRVSRQAESELQQRVGVEQLVGEGGSEAAAQHLLITVKVCATLDVSFTPH